MKCLDKIVGISNTDCECASQAVTPEDRESKSGIFIDEIEGGLKLSDIDKIDCQDFITKTRQARKVAVDKFIESVLAQYATNGGFADRYKRFDGRICKTSHLRTLNLPKYAGLRLRTRLIRGSSIKVSSIGLIWSVEANVSVSVYKSYSGQDLEFVKSINNIPTMANVAVTHKLDEILELPLYDERNQQIDYYFLVDTTLYGFPRDNKATCSCGGSEAILKSYLSVGGVSSTTMNGIAGSESFTVANGIFLDAKIDCTSKESICNLLSLDISNTIAWAIAYKAQEWLIAEVLKEGNINRYTMLSREHWYGKRNHFAKEFDNRIVWLTQTYGYESINDCVTCNDNRIFKGLIR